jgi:hypothetical protein
MVRVEVDSDEARRPQSSTSPVLSSHDGQEESPLVDGSHEIDVVSDEWQPPPILGFRIERTILYV